MLVRGRWQTGRVRERDLLVLSEEPLNAETRLDEKTPAITPAGRHYVRTHFPIPTGPRSIVIDGARSTPASISFDEIRALPARSMVVTLECAGNGRRFLEPKVPGEQWGLGAVGTATWTGASLRDVLRAFAIPSGTVELLFRGADEGVPKDLGRRIRYERSLPIDVALGDDILVAYLMEREPIPPEHGGPLRLIVPGWYGMASVKWLSRVTLLERPFGGFFQTDRYVIDGRPLREIAPRAVIVAPVEGAEILAERSAARVTVRGYAWSGAAPIVRVEVAADPASLIEAQRLLQWRRARHGQATDHAWREFSLELLNVLAGSGIMEMDLTARAVDAAGNVQPHTVVPNALGYANNASRTLRIRVSAR